MKLNRAMTRDPAKYKNPEEFNPDRFLDENGKLNNDDVAYVFGFGRRFVLYFFSSVQRLE
jgi:cytochrome P450